MIVRITSCTNLSLMAGIPNGLTLPGFPAFGIINSFTPTHANLFLSTASRSSNILVLIKESRICPSGPGVLDPLLPFSINLR